MSEPMGTAAAAGAVVEVEGASTRAFPSSGPAVAPSRAAAHQRVAACRQMVDALQPRAGAAVTLTVTSRSGERVTKRFSRPTVVAAIRRAFLEAEEDALHDAGIHPNQLHRERLERKRAAAQTA